MPVAPPVNDAFPRRRGFHHDILRGLLRRLARIDVVRVQDIGLRGADDVAVLTRAAVEGRVLLTHDVSTLIGKASERIRAGSSVPGVIAFAQSMPVGAAIEDLVLVIECSAPEDWSNQVRYLPLR